MNWCPWVFRAKVGAFLRAMSRFPAQAAVKPASSVIPAQQRPPPGRLCAGVDAGRAAAGLNQSPGPGGLRVRSGVNEQQPSLMQWWASVGRWMIGRSPRPLDIGEQHGSRSQAFQYFPLAHQGPPVSSGPPGDPLHRSPAGAAGSGGIGGNAHVVAACWRQPELKYVLWSRSVPARRRRHRRRTLA